MNPAIKAALRLMALSQIVCSQGAPLEWTIFPVEGQGTNAAAQLFDVAFGNGRFVAMERSGEMYRAPADEPHQWSPIAKIPDVDLDAIIFADGAFAAVGRDSKAQTGVFLKSADGMEWSRQTFEAVERLRAVAYGNGQFVVVGGEMVARSSDGIDWTTERDFVRDPQVNFMSLDFVNGEFMATFWDEWDWNVPVAPIKLATSLDGSRWYEHPLAGEGFQSIAYGRKLYVSVGGTDCTPCGWGYYSQDARSWTTTEFPVGFDGLALEYANGVFAISGWGGEGRPSIFMSSTDGMMWEDFQIGTGHLFYGLTFGRGRFVSVGYGLTGDGGVVAVSEFVGAVRSISNLQVNAAAIEFDFNADDRTEWLVEASENLVNWTVVKEVQGTIAEVERVTLPRDRKPIRYLRLKEKQ